jgi:CubicO group peptidase (beta-lactamase class C family)
MRAKTIAWIALLLGVSAAIAQPAPGEAWVPLSPHPTDTPWATDEWPRGALPASFDREALEKLLAVVDRTDTDLNESRQVVVIWRGKLVAERYAKDFGPDVRLVSWSVAKSFTHALVGVAAQRGLIDVDQPLSHPLWSAGDPHARITWRQWLNMVDGMKFRELQAEDVASDDSAHLLFGAGRFDIAAYAAKLPIAHPPGAVWNYNTAGIDLVANALGNRLAPNDSDPKARRAATMNFIADGLFAPIGMRTAQPQFDPAGTFVGGSLVYATAREFAKFGYLYLRDGVWEGRRILPEGWVDFARRKTPADNCDVYGAGWWVVPSAGPGKPVRSLFSAVHNDVFFARGHEGQLIVVSPARDLVLVRLGITPNDGPGWPALGRWTNAILDLFPKVVFDMRSARAGVPAPWAIDPAFTGKSP